MPRVVIITGAAGTIGRAVAQQLSRRGVALGLTDLDTEGLAALGTALPSDAVVAQTLDVRDAERVDGFVAEVVDRLGGLDACILAAGIAGPIGLAGSATDEELAQIFDVNVFAMFRMLRVVLPIMRRRGAGRVIALASGAGLGGAPYIAPYAASKHAVVGLVRSIAIEEAPSGISVNAVCPGLVESPMLSRIEARINSITGTAADPPPIGRNADPAEVAELVAYLALSAPAYITGAALSIDGGLRA